MIEQGTQFGPEVVLGAEVQEMVREDGHFRLVTPAGDFLTRTVCVTAGKGALNPRVLECPGWDDHYRDGGGAHTHVRQIEDFRDRRVLIVGGGDSAVDWVLGLRGVARSGHSHSPAPRVPRAQEQRAGDAGARRARRGAGAYAVRGARHGRGERVRGPRHHLQQRDDEDTHLDADAIIALLGFKPDLGPIARWGLELEKNSIKVNGVMETNIEGVYAAGDIIHYPGKLELISCGYGEAAIAVNNAVHYLNPKARIAPGHSTNLKIFKQDE
jgi:thioredoxin reductase (NADPH)